MQVIKLVVVGDSCADKMHLLYNYTTNSNNNQYIPSDIDDNLKILVVDDKPITLGLWHINGLEDKDRLRPFCYSQTDIFLICYSVVSPSSFESVKQKWYPEVRHYCPKPPIILVATHLELRDNPDILVAMSENKQAPITNAEGLAMAKEIGAVGYLECSLLKLDQVKHVFDEAVRAVLYSQIKPKKKKSECFVS